MTSGAKWAVALAWLVFWDYILNASFQETVKTLPACGLLDLDCNARWSNAHASYTTGMVVALIAIPVPLYIAGRLLETREARDSRAAARATRQAAELRQWEAEEKLELIEQEAAIAKSKIERTEFVQSLGAVCDYLEILPHETEQSRILQIRQGISKELRGIVATYTLDQMAQFLRRDNALKIKLKSMLASLKRAKVASSDADVLREALALATQGA